MLYLVLCCFCVLFYALCFFSFFCSVLSSSPVVIFHSLYCCLSFCVCFYVLYFVLFFFFKQKPAYEMRISYWSSDVCSSDLRLHANGTIVMAVVGKVKHALQVVESGIDMIVAQGHDGGGHNSPVGTISLIPQVVDAVGDRVPVLGAGGITDGRGVEAAFLWGTEGAWVGPDFRAPYKARNR